MGDDYPRTCRFCHVTARVLVKYGTRHYAHGWCLLRARGPESIRRLPKGARGDVPALVAKEAGCLEDWMDEAVADRTRQLISEIPDETR